MVNLLEYAAIKNDTAAANVILVAVSKLKPLEDLQILYNQGQRHFGENYVQELVDKQATLPKDILWHFIGHLQSNKVKYIAPFVHLIQSVDSDKLLAEINKQALKNNRIISILLQVHIAEEATKYGFDEVELMALDTLQFKNVKVVGLMGMATFTDDKEKVKREFIHLHKIYNLFATQKNILLTILSMGMSDDYKLAINCGCNMVRIGSSIFGRR